MTEVTLNILHPFKYPGLRVMSSKIQEKFIHQLSAMFTCRDGNGGCLVARPQKCYINRRFRSRCCRGFLKLLKPPPSPPL